MRSLFLLQLGVIRRLILTISFCYRRRLHSSILFLRSHTMRKAQLRMIASLAKSLASDPGLENPVFFEDEWIDRRTYDALPVQVRVRAQARLSRRRSPSDSSSSGHSATRSPEADGGGKLTRSGYRLKPETGRRQAVCDIRALSCGGESEDLRCMLSNNPVRASQTHYRQKPFFWFFARDNRHMYLVYIGARYVNHWSAMTFTINEEENKRHCASI